MNSIRSERVLGEEAPSILVVEDDAMLGQLVGELLEQHGYGTQWVGEGHAALRRLREGGVDLVLLDIGLPDLDGVSVCRRAREEGYEGPILMVTALGEESDEVLGLEAGADDYVIKPVTPPRLVARVQALLRRSASVDPPAPPVLCGRLRVDPGRRVAELDGRELQLASSEFDLLHLLARNAGRVVERARVFRELRGVEYDGFDRSIDLRISRLRRQLGDDPRRPTWIKTVHGAGYLLAVQS